MTSFVSVCLAAGLAAGSLAPLETPAPASFEARVAAAVARSWGVTADAVRLEWPRSAPHATPAVDTPFRLAGRGREGWFAVVIEAPGAPFAALRVRAGFADTVAVATRALAAGTTVMNGDVAFEPRLRWGPPAGEHNARPAPGWELRRSLAAGEVLAWPSVVPPVLIAGGAPVQLVWERGGVSISLAGVALHDARRGERLRVRVTGQSRTLSGTVTAPGLAMLDGGIQ